METAVIARFLGLDTRPGRFGTDEPTLVSASNADVIPGGAIRGRSRLRKLMDLDAQSVGLYARGGLLHAVVPGGQSIVSADPSQIVYDPIGTGTAAAPVAYPLSKLSRLIAAETYGSSAQYGPFAYVALLRSDTNQVEHHYCQDPLASAATAVATKVSLSFQPGQSLLKLATKMWAPNPGAGTVPFTHSVNGPTDWSTSAPFVGAGFLPVIQHSAGNHLVSTLSHYRNQLAVFFEDSIQLWNVGADPALMSIGPVFNGPGTPFPGSVANVQGDMIYLSRGGFRAMSQTQYSGQPNEEDFLGARIKSLTATIPSTSRALSLWSQTRQQYLCAIGSTVYALIHAPTEDGGGLSAWTTWSLPVTADYLVEVSGNLYLRSGNTLYLFDDSATSDPSGATVTMTVQLRDMTMGAPAMRKYVQWCTIQATATVSVSLVVDGVVLPARTIPAVGSPIRFPLLGQGKRIALKITSTAPGVRIDGISLEYEPLAVG